MSATLSPPNPNEEHIGVKDVCRIYGVCDRTVRDWIRKGVLPPPFRVGPRLLRWRRTDIERHLQGGANGAA